MGKGSFVCCSGAHGPKHSAFLGYFHSLNISFFPSPPNIPSQNFASRWSAPHHPSGKYCLAPQATEYLLYLCMGWVGSGAFPTKHPNELKHVQSEMPIFPLHAASQIHFHYICSILPPSSCTHGLHGPLLPGTLESLQPLGARCSRPWMGAKLSLPNNQHTAVWFPYLGSGRSWYILHNTSFGTSFMYPLRKYSTAFPCSFSDSSVQARSESTATHC